VSWLDTFRNPELSLIGDYSGKLVNKALDGAKAICQLSEAESDGERHGLNKFQLISVFSEFLFFYLHLTDRYAFGNMDEQRRSKIMSELERCSIHIGVEAILEVYCKEWSLDEAEKIRKECMQNFSASMKQYSQHQNLFPESGNTTYDHIKANTVFAGFAGQIAELAGQSENLSCFVCALDHSQIALKNLGVGRFIETAKAIQ